MHTNTKQTPKSCSCRQCKWGKHSVGGNFMMRHDERKYRHNAKTKLSRSISSPASPSFGEEVFTSGPIGNYYD